MGPIRMESVGRLLQVSLLAAGDRDGVLAAGVGGDVAGPPECALGRCGHLAALLGGWFFWPAAVMSVAVGETLLFARPDWLVRCIAGIGPAYLLAWALTMLLISSWRLVYEMVGTGLIALLVGVFISVYISYVLFRTLGLLFRHFRERLPWRS